MFEYYPMREVLELPDGSCEAVMTYASEDWMTRLVLGFGAAVRVLEPESLAQRVRDAAAAALESYQAAGVLTAPRRGHTGVRLCCGSIGWTSGGNQSGQS